MTRPEKPSLNIPVLTPEQEATKLHIKSLKLIAKDVTCAVNHAVNKCEHIWAPTADYRYEHGDYLKKGKWRINCSVRCMICAKFGATWFCPTAPKMVCEYNELKDPACDTCLYCGEPDERK